MVTAVTVTVRPTHKQILCKLYTFYAKVIYFWSITHILISGLTSHCAWHCVFFGANIHLTTLLSLRELGYSQ